jgi:hypothetical protein
MTLQNWYCDKEIIMEELNQEELNLSSGGYWNHVLTYMTLLDLAHDIGRGLGDGFYDGVHSPQIP